MAESAALLIDEVLPPLPLRQWVLTLPIPLRLLCATDSPALSEILRIVYRCLSAHLLSAAHLDKHRARTGAVTFIQRFGGSVNLNIHFHILALDGVYRLDPTAKTLLHFRPVHPPTPLELQALLERIAQRIGRRLERLGYLTRDGAEGQDPHLSFPNDAEPPEDQATLLTLQQAAITYRIAAGPHAAQKAFTLKTLPPSFEDKGPELASAHGFSLHAGVACSPREPELLQRLARYIARPALAESRLSLTPQGDLRYRIKSPWRDGTTHLIFHPLDFLARLASLVPKPRVNLTRYHGILAPHARERSLITPATRRAAHKTAEQHSRSPAQHRQRMTWAERLRRVFNIDVSLCERCGGTARIIACIENPEVIRRILTHLTARGPPQPDLLSA
jgi:hypothetical protein